MKKQFNQFHHAAKQCESNNSWDLFRSGTKIGAISEDGQMLHLSIVATNIPFRNTDLEEISSLMKDIQSANRKTTFETGATSAAVNELILYTDNTKELAERRDKYFSAAYDGKRTLAICIIDLYWDAIYCYKKEFPYGAQYRPVKDMTQIEMNEYATIYANRFADWKKERERQANQSK